MQQMVETILATYGTSVTLQQGETAHAIRAFFQPVRSKSWQYLEGNYSPLGEIPRGQYVYIGPVEPKANAGDTSPLRLTTLKHGIPSGSGLTCRANPTTLAHLRFPASAAICPYVATLPFGIWRTTL